MSGAGLPTADDVFGHMDHSMPTAEDAFGPEHPVQSGPAQDGYFSAVGNSVTHVLDAFSQGAKDGWGDTPHVISPDAEKWLQKAGTFNDYKNGRTSIIKSANEALMRPAAAALDAILHPIATAEATMGGIGAATQEVGGQIVSKAKDVRSGGGAGGVIAPVIGETGEIIGSVPQGFGLEFPLHPFTPADLEKARRLKVIGQGEGGYFGTKEATPAEGLQAAVKQMREEAENREPGTGEPVTPEEKARAAGGRPPQPDIPDIHSVAREIAPGTFKEYDALSAEREAYRRQIEDLSASRTEIPEAQAAQAKVDSILGKVSGVESRLTKSAAIRLDDAREELDDLLHRDTPEMQQVRKQMLATDYRMRDLAPQVAQAYREARARVPEPEAPVAAPAEAPQQPEQRPPQVVPANIGTEAPDLATPSVTGEEKLGAVKKPPVDIASDVTQKLVAAGRPQEEANAAAAIVAAHYEARAARFEGRKGTASDLYLKDAPEIRGAGIRKRALEMAQTRTLHQDEFKTEPGAVDAHGNPLPQTIIPGAEGNAKQLAAARESKFKGLKGTARTQKEAGGLFEGEQTTDQGTLFQGRRGSITLGESRNVIKLFKDADPSTFMHESAHHWLEELRADASDPQAPPDLLKDSKTVHDWLGAKEGEKLTRAQHEKFARGFERYLMEGRAPSRSLADVFAKFRDWLTKIYQTVTRLKAPINDDIRGVFDRLIAAKPEPVVIAPERPVEAHLADIHEHEAEHTPPERASPVADHIRSEVNSVTKEKAPDVHAGLPTNEAGGIEGQNAPLSGGPDAARSFPGDEGNAEAPRTQPARGDETARKGVTRAAYESALEAIKRWRSRPPKIRDVLGEIRDKGGIKLVNAKGERVSEAGDIEQALKDYQAPKGAKGFTRGDKTRLINNEGGVSPDYVREALAEDGWFGSNRDEAVHNTDINDLIDLIRRAAQEGTAFHPEDDAVLEIEARKAFEEELNEADVTHSDPPEWAAHKLAVWRATEEAKQYAREQENAHYEELSRLEPALAEELESHGYEPGSDYGAEFETGEEHRGDYGGLTEREAFEPKTFASASGQSAIGANHPGTEPLAGPNQRFTDTESRYVDKAGNIVLDNLNTNDDVKAVLRQIAEENDQFLSARRGVVSDSDVMAFADAMGVAAREVNIQKLRAISLQDGVPLAARIRVGREMLIQSAQAVHDAMQGTDELAYATAAQRHLMVQETLSAITAEVGRGLRAFRNMGDEASKAQTLSDFLKENTGRTLFQLQDEMKKGRRLDTPAKVSGFLRDVRKPGFWAMALEIFKNWLISGPVTHMTYSVANTVLAMWKAVPETAMEATIGALRGTPEADRVRYGEVGAQLYAMLRGQRNGFQAAWDAMKAGQTMALPGEGETTPLFPGGAASTPFTNTKAIPGVAGTIVRAPGERMVAPIHSYFRSIGYAQGIARQAYRAAANEGLRGDAFHRRIAELTTRPTEEMMKTARDEATEQTLMGRGGELTKRVSALMNWEPEAPIGGHIKPFAFIDPFVHIASNIVEQSIIERSPLAYFSKELREDILGHNGVAAQNSTIARALTGTALGVTGMGLAMEGLLTPSAPSDPKEAAQWQRVHGMPHSLTLGDVSVDLSRLGVLGFQLGIAADLYHAGKVAMSGDEDRYKVAGLLVHSFTQNFLDEGFMRGPSDLIKALDDNERYGASYVRNFVSTAAVPYSVGMAQLAKQVDPYAREARTTMDAIKAKVPWWSETLFPRRDIWGEPMPNREWLGTYTQGISHDPVDLALMEVGVYPAKVQRKIRGIELTDHQYDDYARIAGRTAKMQLNTLVTMDGFGSLPLSVRQEMIKEAITSSRENARSLMMMQYPDLIQKAAEAKAAALQ